MDPLEHEARKHHLNYIRLTGNVGAMVNGAGLAMATMDLIKAAGAEPANFLDVGGGASAEMVANGFRIILGDPNVKGVLINIFGGILRCDVLANGVVEAVKTGAGQGAHHRPPGRDQRGAGPGDPGQIRPHLHRGHRHAGRGQESGGAGGVR